MPYNLPLFHIPQFPSTRYQGSKNKLVDWIWENLSSLDFHTCLDAFGGTGVIAYRLKQADKCVTYNDSLRFNYHFGRALIENSQVKLSDADIDWLLQPNNVTTYPSVITNNFKDIYFTDDENRWLDQTLTNIEQLENPYKFSIAFFALCQACIIKRPYNLFHRKNLYVRLADVERSFGNKTTWDTPFEDWFRKFAQEANDAVFDNGEKNSAVHCDALEITGNFDLVYIDPPYISKRGVGTDYRSFYHFLEGMTMYDTWEQHIDQNSKHRRLIVQKSAWTDKHQIHDAFQQLFEHYKDSILVVSYRSDGIPSIPEIVNLMRPFKHEIHIHEYGKYQYALSKNSKSKEVLIIGK